MPGGVRSPGVNVIPPLELLVTKAVALLFYACESVDEENDAIVKVAPLGIIKGRGEGNLGSAHQSPIQTGRSHRSASTPDTVAFGPTDPSDRRSPGHCSSARGLPLGNP